MITIPRKPKIFFAIPCGTFYSIQADVIRTVSEAIDAEAIIAEDSAQTVGLWDKIAHEIDSSDLFVADISSASPNIILELGYAMKGKSMDKTGIFISDNVLVPSDLQGLVYQKYTSYSDFQDKLIRWVCESLPLLDPKWIKGLDVHGDEIFYDDFKSQENFLKLWSFFPGSSFILTHEGLRFTNSTFPILTTTLALLKDCEFEFRARIERSCVGWVVKGTKNPQSFLPSFCVMFNLHTNGTLRPHIWNSANPDTNSGYYVYPDRYGVRINKSSDDWFTLITRIRGDVIEIENEKNVIIAADFSTEQPHASIYNNIGVKEGQVGFRCDSGEEATINYVRVRGI